MTQLPFETSLNNLEKIVAQLESGKLSLEDSIKAFESGVKLVSQCQKLLNEAEKKIEVLTKGGDGKPLSAAFNEGNEGEEK